MKELYIECKSYLSIDVIGIICQIVKLKIVGQIVKSKDNSYNVENFYRDLNAVVTKLESNLLKKLLTMSAENITNYRFEKNGIIDTDQISDDDIMSLIPEIDLSPIITPNSNDFDDIYSYLLGAYLDFTITGFIPLSKLKCCLVTSEDHDGKTYSFVNLFIGDSPNIAVSDYLFTIIYAKLRNGVEKEEISKELNISLDLINKVENIHKSMVYGIGCYIDIDNHILSDGIKIPKIIFGWDNLVAIDLHKFKIPSPYSYSINSNSTIH